MCMAGVRDKPNETGKFRTIPGDDKAAAICDIAMNIGTLINCTFITLASNFMKIIL
jgi:hypothetical protein